MCAYLIKWFKNFEKIIKGLKHGYGNFEVKIFLLSNNIWSKKVGLCKSDRKQDRTIFSDWSKDCFDNEKIRNSLSYFRPGHKSNLNFFDRVWFQGFHWEFLKHHWPSMRCVLNHDASFKIRFMSKSLRTIYLRQIELQSILMSSEHAMFVSNLVAQYIYVYIGQ